MKNDNIKVEERMNSTFYKTSITISEFIKAKLLRSLNG
jgi:hypothetical protein